MTNIKLQNNNFRSQETAVLHTSQNYRVWPEILTTTMVSNKTELQNNICMHCTGMSGYFDPMFVLHFELSLRCFSSTVDSL
jgi:hypothetical protein